MAKITANMVSKAFIVHWIIPYGIPNFVLTYNGPQFTEKCFASMFGYQQFTHLTTTSYHLRDNGQTERYKKTLMDRLGHYVGEHQNYRDDYVHLLYGYKIQFHLSTKTTPFSIWISRQLNGPDTSHISKTIRNTQYIYGLDIRLTDLKYNLVQYFYTMVLWAERALTQAQEIYKRYFDHSSQPRKPLTAGM